MTPRSGVSTDSFSGSSRPGLAILWVSVLALFLELLLIRWVGTEIRIFAYLQNAVLVVCFLGLGAGLLTSRREIQPARVVAVLLVLVGLLSLTPTRLLLLGISQDLSMLGDLNIWYARAGEDRIAVAVGVARGLALTFVVMALLVAAFVPLGRVLGRLMNAHPQPLLAYSVNIAGSLAGTWLFVGLSQLGLPPGAWFAVMALLFLPFVARRDRAAWVPAAGLVALVALASASDQRADVLRTVWSPYQKLELFESRTVPEGPVDRYTVSVNNVGYQLIADLRPATLMRSRPPVPLGLMGMSQYDVPLLLHSRPQNVLVVGAGAGNDVAGALRNGALRITAVEIDPAIVAFGREFHPEQPYASGQVRVVVDDARSFFARTPERYDVVVFGLLDSHTTTAMTNARLDHYVYTVESLRRVKQLLREDGILFLSFETRRHFIADRIAGGLKEVFGEEPMVFRIPKGPLGWGGTMFVAGDLDGARARIAERPQLAALMADWNSRAPEIAYASAQATDDWPYLYLEGPGIPPLFVLLTGLFAVLALCLWRSLGRPTALDLRSWTRVDRHFFFLGAAFLLLEVQNISKASVVLGNTWLVNAVVISGVLVMALVANLVAARWPRLPQGPVYAALLGTAVGLYFVDLARFAFLPYATKAAVVGALTTLPMLFSGIVFARSFAAAPRKAEALGANLLGALGGALLQSLSFLPTRNTRPTQSPRPSLPCRYSRARGAFCSELSNSRRADRRSSVKLK
ncbi:MAG: hypothetical protein ABR527_01130 [Gemmatimonadota bacterium]